MEAERQTTALLEAFVTTFWFSLRELSYFSFPQTQHGKPGICGRTSEELDVSVDYKLV